jgi:hypothetical protein
MNDIFNLQRFWFLFRKTIIERRLQIAGIFLLSILGAFLMYYSPIFTSDGRMHTDFDDWYIAQSNSFGSGFIIGSVILSGILFNYFSDSEKGYSYLTLPTSYFEKWLCGIVIMLFFITAYHLIFRAMDIVFVNYYHKNIVSLVTDVETFKKAAVVMRFNVQSLRIIYFFMMALSSVVVVGSLYFNKLALIKSVCIGVGVFIALQFLNGTVAGSIFDEDVSTTFFFSRIYLIKSNIGVHLTPALSGFFENLYTFILPIVLWFIALIRLREKEF